MAKSIFDLLGDFVLQESNSIKSSEIAGHNAITIIGANPNNNYATLIDYYPTTHIKNVFLTKDDTEPIDLINPKCHLTEEEHRLLTTSPLAGGLVCLDQNGWIPLEYFDKTCICMYYEYATFEDLLVNNVFEQDKHYGRLVMVNDIRDTDPAYSDEPTAIWGIYRLIGDPHQPNGWLKVQMPGYDIRVITWDMVDPGFRSTVQEIDEMARLSHWHSNKECLKQFHIDDQGRLVYRDKAVMMRKDFNTLLMDIKASQLERLNDGDSGAIIYSSRAVVIPEPATYVDTEGLESISGYYLDRADISEILYMDTTKFDNFDSFCKNCYNLEILPALDYSNAVNMRESFKNCTKLETFYGMNIPKVKYLVDTWKNCKRLAFIGNIENSSNVEHISGAFSGCESLTDLPSMDFSKIKYFENFCCDCKSLQIFNAEIQPVNFRGAFYGCESLFMVKTIDFSKCRSTDICFKECPRLAIVEIVPNTLTTSISFENTSLEPSSAMEIIEGLPSVSTTQTIDLTNTPAAGISNTYIQLAESKGWIIKR